MKLLNAKVSNGPGTGQAALYIGVNSNALTLTIGPNEDGSPLALTEEQGKRASFRIWLERLPAAVGQGMKVQHADFSVVPEKGADGAPSGAYLLQPHSYPYAITKPLSFQLTAIALAAAVAYERYAQLVVSLTTASGETTERHLPIPTTARPQPELKTLALDLSWSRFEDSVPTGFGEIETNGKRREIATRRSFFIKNPDRRSAVVTEPKADGTPTRFYVYFVPAQSEAAPNVREAVATIDQLKDVVLSVSDRSAWAIDRSPDENMEWCITAFSDSLLGPGESVEITIDNLATTLPPGLSSIFIRHEGVHGYNDDYQTLDIEKVAASPTIARFAAEFAAAPIAGAGSEPAIYQGQAITLSWDTFGCRNPDGTATAAPVQLTTSDPQREWPVHLPATGALVIHPTGGTTGLTVLDLSLDTPRPDTPWRKIIPVGPLSASITSNIAGPVPRGTDITFTATLGFVHDYALEWGYGAIRRGVDDIRPKDAARRSPVIAVNEPAVVETLKLNVIEPTTVTLTANGLGGPLTRSVSIAVQRVLVDDGIYMALDNAIWLITPELALKHVVDIDGAHVTDVVAYPDPKRNDDDFMLEYGGRDDRKAWGFRAVFWGYDDRPGLFYVDLDSGAAGKIETAAPVISIQRLAEALIVLHPGGQMSRAVRREPIESPDGSQPRWPPLSDWEREQQMARVPLSKLRFDPWSPVMLQMSGPLTALHVMRHVGDGDGERTYMVESYRQELAIVGPFDQSLTGDPEGNGSHNFNGQLGGAPQPSDIAFTIKDDRIGSVLPFVPLFAVLDNQLIFASIQIDPKWGPYFARPPQPLCPAKLAGIQGLFAGRKDYYTAYWIETDADGRPLLCRWSQQGGANVVWPDSKNLPGKQVLLHLPGKPRGTRFAVV